MYDDRISVVHQVVSADATERSQQMMMSQLDEIFVDDIVCYIWHIGVYEAATLYYQPSLGYPIVVLHEDTATASSPSSSSACTGVHVRLLRWPTPSMFGQQLKEADRIEGYDVATDHGEYVRRRIDVKEVSWLRCRCVV